MVDYGTIYQKATERTSQNGIIFIDKIDKITGESKDAGQASREGVQRDVSPIAEGSTV